MCHISSDSRSKEDFTNEYKGIARKVSIFYHEPRRQYHSVKTKESVCPAITVGRVAVENAVKELDYFQNLKVIDHVKLITVNGSIAVAAQKEELTV